MKTNRSFTRHKDCQVGKTLFSMLFLLFLISSCVKEELPVRPITLSGKVLEAGTFQTVNKCQIILFSTTQILDREIYEIVEIYETDVNGDYSLVIPEELRGKKLFLAPRKSTHYTDWTFTDLRDFAVDTMLSRRDFYIFKPGNVFIDCKTIDPYQPNFQVEVSGKRESKSSWKGEIIDGTTSLKVDAHVPYQLKFDTWVDGVRSTFDTTILVKPEVQDTLRFYF